jgi:hypothetical protein
MYRRLPDEGHGPSCCSDAKPTRRCADRKKKKRGYRVCSSGNAATDTSQKKD